MGINKQKREKMPTTMKDLMETLVRIFDNHAGEDKLLDTTELYRLMSQELPSLFNEANAEQLMAKLDTNLDGRVSFDEFLFDMAKRKDAFLKFFLDNNNEMLFTSLQAQIQNLKPVKKKKKKKKKKS